ncbi:MAG: anthranilate synthase component I family protein [Ferruginibacter sp.]
MNEREQNFTVSDLNAFRIKMLNWVNRFSIFCLLDNRQYDLETAAFECMLGAGSKESITCVAGNAFETLKQFHDKKKTWLMGHLGYGLKNENEKLVSAHPDNIGFKDLQFFIPEILIRLKKDVIAISCSDPERIFEEINNFIPAADLQQTKIKIQKRISQDEYEAVIKKLQQHILRGDCYEINFCQEFFAEDIVIDPVMIYKRLTDFSPNPFSSLYRQDDKYCICASPERYLKKSGDHLFSQPIKGTSRRDLKDSIKDEAAKTYLLQSAKEKSENVMVVDLVRNDLSRVCTEGTVKVDELFGLYSFPQVHQLISTVSGRLRNDLHFVDAIKATFPMGSMTGAPKKRVMELIEQYEKTARGLFSGAIGYISPDGDFDFNVVIRSIFYNADKKYLSFQTGGAITFYSDTAEEYEECLLKAESIMKILE